MYLENIVNLTERGTTHTTEFHFIVPDRLELVKTFFSITSPETDFYNEFSQVFTFNYTGLEQSWIIIKTRNFINDTFFLFNIPQQ